MINNISEKSISVRDCHVNNSAVKINHDDDFDQKLRKAESEEQNPSSQNPPPVTPNNQHPVASNKDNSPKNCENKTGEGNKQESPENGNSKGVLTWENHSDTPTKSAKELTPSDEPSATLTDGSSRLERMLKTFEKSDKLTAYNNSRDGKVDIDNQLIIPKNNQILEDNIKINIDQSLPGQLKKGAFINPAAENDILNNQFLAQFQNISKIKISKIHQDSADKPTDDLNIFSKSENKGSVNNDIKSETENEPDNRSTRFKFDGARVESEEIVNGKNNKGNPDSIPIDKSSEAKEKNQISHKGSNSIIIPEGRLTTENLFTSTGKNIKVTQTYHITQDEFTSKTLQLAKNLTSDSASQAKLILKPPALGTVFVDLSLDNSNLKIMIQADNREAVKNIENQISSLRDKLVQNGLKPEIIEVRFKDNGRDLNNYNGSEYQRSFSQKEHKNLRREFMQSFMADMKKLEILMDNIDQTDV